MKIYILIIVAFFSVLSLQGQNKKKDVKKNKIKSITVMVINDDEESGSKQRKDSYEEYNSDGKLTAKLEFKKDGTIKYKETNVYDTYGNKIEETLFELKDKKNVKKFNKYNAMKDKIEELEYKGDSLIKKTTFKYNADGNVISENIFDASGVLKKKVSYTYNSKKLKEVKQTTDADGKVKSVRKYSYEYY